MPVQKRITHPVSQSAGMSEGAPGGATADEEIASGLLCAQKACS